MLFVLLLAIGIPANAQTTAQISGKITDTSGAIVPGARVTVTNESIGVSSSPVTSNDSGGFMDLLGRFFDTSAFSLNAPLTFGSAPRIQPNLYGPGAKYFGISVFKTTAIERDKLGFRAEAFHQLALKLLF